MDSQLWSFPSQIIPVSKSQAYLILDFPCFDCFVQLILDYPCFLQSGSINPINSHNFQTALCVLVAGGCQSPITITFQDYDHGDAPVRVENFCDDVFIKIHQKLVICLYFTAQSLRQLRIVWT